MDSVKYIGMDVHKESISIAVMNSAGKIVLECVVETKASIILQLINGLGGDLQVTLEEEPGPPGCTTCLNPMSPGSWCAIRGRMPP